MPCQGLAMLSAILIWCAGAEVPVTVIKPATAPEPGARHYTVQVRILEVDEQGRGTVIATPTVQTTGAAAGVTVDSDRGRRFEFHFTVTEPGAPSPLPVVLTEEDVAPKPIATTSSTTIAIDRLRDQRVSITAVQRPRREVLKEIAQQAGLRLVLEPEAAAAAADALVTPVTCQLDKVPLNQALAQLVQPMKLDFAVESGLVLLRPEATRFPPSSESPSDNWQIRVYDVSDLVAKDANSERPDFRPILTRLQAAVLPKSWESAGGEATVRGFASTMSLVIRQTPAGHDAVAKFLAELRSPSH